MNIAQAKSTDGEHLLEDLEVQEGRYGVCSREKKFTLVGVEAPRNP